MMRRRNLLSLAAGAAVGLPALAATPVRTRVETTLGSFIIEVDPAVAPITVANYLRYVDGGFLDKASVYRIVTLANQSPETKHKIEVIQWGMKLEDDQKPPFPPIVHETTRETGLRHLDGTVSMARSTPGSAAGEFFICVGDQPELDYGGRRNPDGQGFAAFGRVVGGQGPVKALFGRAEAEQFLKTPIQVTRVLRI
jgi:peptidyl-prolyl cis-trans isomerase A (cyclophilin A)